MSRKKKLILISSLSVLLTIAGSYAFYTYNKFFKAYVSENSSKEFLLIPTGSDIHQISNLLFINNFVSDTNPFLDYIDMRGYSDKLKSGRYKIEPKMSVHELVLLLVSGRQTPVKFTFNNIRFIEKFAGIAGEKLEIDSVELMNAFNSPEIMRKYGFDAETRSCMFLPNTYELYWNISLDDFLAKMKKEYDAFWTSERKAKAQNLGLDPIQVSILASIVQEETNKKDEMSRIAGVYMNRLKKGMLLQADPTARFAYGDFAVQRITNNYLIIDSPYNTYKYKGLPPGPICMPNPNTIDKVLNLESHSYYYFCAKADNSGYHAFAANLDEHNRNAAAYHRFLNKKGIK